MKKFLKNKDNIIILIVSLIALIAGCLSLGFVKSFIIIGIADAIFFLPEILRKKRKKPRTKTQSIKEKKKKKKIWKIILIIFIVGCILAMVAIFGFAMYIVKNAPKFDEKSLYAKESTIIYDVNGEIIAKLGAERRIKISYDELPEVLIDAIIATEDADFFQHNGFDLARFLKASVTQVLSGGSSGGGASTITMQVVKNNLTNKKYKMASSGFQGIVRKFTDIYVSVFEVEKRYTKKEILEFYTNTYYLGSGAYGVEQASQTYFDKSAKDLNLAEAAMIAGLFQAPNAYDPYNNPELAEERRNTVLYLMKRHGYITDEEYKIAKAVTVEEMLNNNNVKAGNEWQAFIDVVVNEVIEDTKSDANPDGLDPATTPMEIYTTMDKEKQTLINKIMSGETYKWPNDVATAGISVVDVNTGAILAIGGGRDKSKERTLSTATQNPVQIGSTSKPLFDYGPGIEYENWSTYTLYSDEPHSYSTGVGVSNWDRGFNGLMTMRTALGQSRNIPALKAFQANDNSNIQEFTKNLGLHPDVDSSGLIHESHSIGGYSGETTLTMASAYASFANGGYYIEPYSYTKIVYKDSDETTETKINKNKVMSEETAYMMTSLLQSAAEMGLYGQYNIGGATYGAKTGTSNFDDATLNSHPNWPANAVNDLWVTGISPDYAISVWYGYLKRDANYVSTAYTANHRTLFQAVARGVFKQGSNWTKPEGVTEVEVEFGTWPAKLPSEYTPGDLRVTELFKKGSEPTEVSDRFSKLDSVTNLKGTVTNNKLTLTWTGISPNAINGTKINELFTSLYGDEGHRNGAISARNQYNNSNIGSLVYKVYSKDNSGNLTLIKQTSDTKLTINVTSSSPTKYVVVASYTIFTANASSGAEVTVSLKNVSTALTATLKSNEAELSVGDTYAKPTDYSTIMTVLDGTTDITSKATIKETYTKGSTAVDAITTTAAGTYTIKYTITYNGTSITKTRTLKVIE